MTNQPDRKQDPTTRKQHTSYSLRRPLGLAAVFLAAAAVLGLLLLNMQQVAADEDDLAKPATTYGTHATDVSLPLPTTIRDVFLPGTQPNTIQDLIPAPQTCSTCHSTGIYTDWRGSMMAQAGRDPVFWAALEVANKDANGVGDYCLRCHVPKAWLEGRSHPADGSGLCGEDGSPNLSDSCKDEFGGQIDDFSAAVACEVCHRMVDPVPGAQDEVADIDIAIRDALTATLPVGHVSSGMLIIDPQDRRRGPFSLPGFGFHTAFQSEFVGQSNAVASSRLCGSCHNVDNPVMSWTENPPGGGPPQYWPNEFDAPAPSFAKGDTFPIERTYDEWRNSAYAYGGIFAPQFAGADPSGVVESCQDCHMERQTGYAAIPALGATFRDCVTTGCLPGHILVGGNSWVPQILQDSRWRLHNGADAPQLQQTVERARSMLKRAAVLTARLDSNNGQTVAEVRIINQTGHKLPTGYPEGRRMWLNLQAFDDGGTLIYESGAYDADTGKLIPDPDIQVYEAKQGLTPELAAELGMEAGETFHFVLNNTTIKDNRIPPRGFTNAAFDQPGMRPVGASYADGQFWDLVTYNVPAETVRVVATLYYQTSSGDYIEFLREKGGADAQVLGQLWDDNKSPPEIMARIALSRDGQLFIPITNR